VDEIELAWQLAELTSSHLRDAERRAAYVALGAGDALGAITVLVAVAVGANVVVGDAIADQLCRWLDSYLGQPFEPGLRRQIEAMRCTNEVVAPSADAAPTVGTPNFLVTVRRYRRRNA
jgi:hypothetical protein